jgi:hypothetical protein
METVVINFKEDRVVTYKDIWTTAISGNHLILIRKQAETNVNDLELDSYVLTTSEIIDLSTIQNYTVKTKTKKYDQK